MTDHPLVNQLGRSFGVAPGGSVHTKNATTGVRHCSFRRQVLRDSLSRSPPEPTPRVHRCGAIAEGGAGPRTNHRLSGEPEEGADSITAQQFFPCRTVVATNEILARVNRRRPRQPAASESTSGPRVNSTRVNSTRVNKHARQRSALASTNVRQPATRRATAAQNATNAAVTSSMMGTMSG